MKFNVDAFKRFNKYINTDAKVRLTQAPWGLLHHSEVILEPWSFLVFRCWFEIGEYWESVGRLQRTVIHPCAVLVLGWTLGIQG